MCRCTLPQIDQVTEAQFRNGLSQLGLQVTGDEAKLLMRKFAGVPGHVNYVLFACAIDDTLRTFSSREPRSYVTQVPPSLPPASLPPPRPHVAALPSPPALCSPMLPPRAPPCRLTHAPPPPLSLSRSRGSRSPEASASRG